MDFKSPECTCFLCDNASITVAVLMDTQRIPKLVCSVGLFLVCSLDSDFSKCQLMG
jgi:hypothetical protein